MKQLFQKLNYLKVLTAFFENPYDESYLREIARKLRMSPATVQRALGTLEKEGLVSRRNTNNASYFKATMSGEFKALKLAFTLSIIEEAGIVRLIVEKSSGLNSILLYGSAARGEDDRKSDYDLLVISAGCRARAIEISEMLGKESSLQSYAISEWKEISKKNRAFYIEVITSSIALYGHRPVID